MESMDVSSRHLRKTGACARKPLSAKGSHPLESYNVHSVHFAHAACESVCVERGQAGGWGESPCPQGGPGPAIQYRTRHRCGSFSNSSVEKAGAWISGLAKRLDVAGKKVVPSKKIAAKTLCRGVPLKSAAAIVVAGERKRLPLHLPLQRSAVPGVPPAAPGWGDGFEESTHGTSEKAG